MIVEMVMMICNMGGWFWMLVIPSSLVALVLMFKVLQLLWWRPRMIEKHFSEQGIKGPPYRFFIGNVKELMSLMLKASSSPMSPSHNIVPRVLSFYHHWKKIYGATFLVWFGPTPRLTVSDPDLIREIFASRSEFYEKNESHPLVRQLEGDGLLSLKGEKWAHHRKIITPTFHMDNLKLLIPVMGKSVTEMLEKWSEITESGEAEIEVSDWFQTLTEEIITRTAFGSSYEDGKAVFRLQTQQMVYAAEAFRKLSTIVYETLRLYPPAIATIRRAKTDVDLGSYKVPRGTELLIPILAVHHDPGLWGQDACEFNPDRFSEGVARAAKHPMAFIPFGLGARTCIGQNLAILQAKLAMAAILRRFEFRISSSYQHAPTVLMLLYPQYGAPVMVRRWSGGPTETEDQGR
ncbi:hypothetical protein Syun_011036 [Stephania yunnanensis]|uniref:Cytochrome P450 n=1 Tax=Stephania yunnanensis TaxID=152371 RepID=A0AAP0JWS8_9MAGN